MNAKIYNGNVQPNPKEFKIWVNDEGTIKTWNGTEWVGLSGGSGSGDIEANAEYCLLHFRGAMGAAGVEVDVIRKQIAYFTFDINTGEPQTFNSFADFISAQSELRGNSVYPIEIDFDNKIIIVQNFTKEYDSVSTDISILCNSEIIGTGFMNGGSSYELFHSFIPLPFGAYLIEDASTALVGKDTSGKLVKIHDVIKKDSDEILVTIYMYQGEEANSSI